MEQFCHMLLWGNPKGVLYNHQGSEDSVLKTSGQEYFGGGGRIFFNVRGKSIIPRSISVADFKKHASTLVD